jgi:hypothetical protein
VTTSAPSTTCSPAWATRRRPERPTVGAGVARVAALLGRPLIPWQRDLADVAGEVDPDTGRFAYQRVVMIVPRRAGKSVLQLAEGLDVGRRQRHARSFYASHRRETAAAMWRDDWFPWLEESPLARHLAMRRANGSESITWRHARSTFRLLPPDGAAMRSFSSHLALIDEGREFSAEQGEAIEGGVFPTQATIATGGQTWIASSAGDLDAQWLARWRDLGRTAVAEDRPDRICYLEFAAPAGADPDDPDTWRAAHPGLGHHVLIDALAADHEVMSPDTFAAEYLGWWPEARIDHALVDAWATASNPRAAISGPPVFGIDTTVDRDRTVIVAAGPGAAGGWCVELVEDRAHGPWVLDRLAELVDRWSPLALVWDAGGPVGALAPGLGQLATRPTPLTTREVTAAAGAAHDGILAGHWTHREDPALTEAVARARRRDAGGSWLWDRRQPEVIPLIAATLAAWVAADPTRAAPRAY